MDGCSLLQPAVVQAAAACWRTSSPDFKLSRMTAGDSNLTMRAPSNLPKALAYDTAVSFRNSYFRSL
jgi:hypothetical protein